MKTEPTELEEQLTSSQRDIGLILDDVKRRDLNAAIHGMETVIADLEQLRDATRKAVNAYERIGGASKRKIKWVAFETNQCAAINLR